ncbi:hypothetical protein CRE_20340 [Caenorhabditis remanei]|uniref:Serpentine receptor class gamma n=1 Tax=Caenorhabditis remanei TaxID=31234 RepID=E3MCV1_CAERE|nr:hypothetical protein CRE_20340 [Caenorhabditis remanei]
MSSFILPSNFSYDDPLPFQCVNDNNTTLSISFYIIQASYLLLGSVLNALIVKLIIFSNKNSYKTNSFYILYTADAIVTIYHSIIEVLFARVISFITPLCPILSPYFFTPSVITKIYAILIHYSTSFRIISQIFMSFNRMTCVILPFKHEKIWRVIIYPVLICSVVIPLDTTWILLFSRVYINPNGAGFSVNYKEPAGWPTLALVHLIECVFCIALVISCFIFTIMGLTRLKNRIKKAERSLTFVTMIMAFQTLLLAIIQIYFAFFGSSTPNIRRILVKVFPFVIDSLNVFSPIALILMNRPLKNDILKRKENNLSGNSRSASTTQQQNIFRISPKLTSN